MRNGRSPFVLACALALLAAGRVAAQPAPATQPADRRADELAALDSLGAPTLSLFFLPAEMELGEALLQGQIADQQARELAEQQAVVPVAPPPPPPDVHLGALVYLGPDRWVLWLNGEARTPRSHGGEFRVVAVTADRARIAWAGGGGTPGYQVDLKPYQTYLAEAGSVVEGNNRGRAN